MTLLPELELELTDAADRRGRRRRGVHTAAVMAAALLALAGIGLVTLESAQPPAIRPAASSPQPAKPPTSAARRAAALAESYSVFAQPRTRTDRVPDGRSRTARALRNTRIDLSESRKVAQLGDVAAYAAPGVVEGRLAVCTWVLRRNIGGFGCGEYRPRSAALRPPSSRTTLRPGSVYFYLLPDSVREVTLVLRDGGQRLTQAVTDNGALLRPPSGALRAEWKSADGRITTQAYYDDPNDETD